MCNISNSFSSASQTITLLRAHLLAPALPVPPLHTSGPALSTAWAPNLARSATPRWAAGSQPATSPPHPWPVTHPPPSLFPHSALPLRSQALPKPFTRTTAKPCPHPPSLDMLSGPGVPNHPDPLFWSGYSRLRSCLVYIMLIRSRTPPADTHWKCHFTVRETCWVTQRQRVPAEAPILGPITAGLGVTSAARGWGTLGLNDLSNLLWCESSTYQSDGTPLRSRKQCRRWALTSRRRKPTPQLQWQPQLQVPKPNIRSISTECPGCSLDPKPVRRWSWKCQSWGGSHWCHRSQCKAQRRASRTSGSRVQMERNPTRNQSWRWPSLHLSHSRPGVLSLSAVRQQKPPPLLLRSDHRQSAEKKLHKKGIKESDSSLLHSFQLLISFLSKVVNSLTTCLAESEWEKILLEFCNCKYLPQAIADILVLFITFVNYDELVTVKEASCHWFNSQGSTFLYPFIVVLCLLTGCFSFLNKCLFFK